MRHSHRGEYDTLIPPFTFAPWRGTFLSVLGLSPAVSWLDGKTRRNSGRALQVFATKGLSRAFLYEEGSKYVRSRLLTHANSKVLEAIREGKLDLLQCTWRRQLLTPSPMRSSKN